MNTQAVILELNELPEIYKAEYIGNNIYRVIFDDKSLTTITGTYQQIMNVLEESIDFEIW